MLKIQQNKVFDLIKDLTGRVTDFETRSYTEKVGFEVFEVGIKNANLYFNFERSPHDFNSYKIRYSKFTPNRLRTTWEPIGSYLSFEEALMKLKSWVITELNFYWKEFDSVNLWNTYTDFGTLKTNPNKNLNTTTSEVFKEEEKYSIKKSLEELKVKLISTVEANQKDKELIIDRLDYLKGKVDNSSIIDWKNLAAGTFMGLISNLTTDVETGNKLWNLILLVFENAAILPHI